MRKLVSGFVLGSLLLGSSIFADELKIGDRMPGPRGEKYNWSSIIKEHDPYLKTVFSVNYDSGDVALYLGCNEESVYDAVVKREPFGVYRLNGNGTKVYYLDNSLNFSDKHIDGVFSIDADEFRIEFDDAPSCEGKI
ncbi:hypothetical protein HYT25_03150 [Candidatus Pacearchaeota archaeon]|nr:hypothetical protein [Candidatus Pacearchaeota archaeon]